MPTPAPMPTPTPTPALPTPRKCRRRAGSRQRRRIAAGSSTYPGRSTTSSPCSPTSAAYRCPHTQIRLRCAGSPPSRLSRLRCSHPRASSHASPPPSGSSSCCCRATPPSPRASTSSTMLKRPPGATLGTALGTALGSAPLPPQGAPGGSGRLDAPRGERPGDWVPSHCLGCSSAASKVADSAAL